VLVSDIKDPVEIRQLAESIAHTSSYAHDMYVKCLVLYYRLACSMVHYITILSVLVLRTKLKPY